MFDNCDDYDPARPWTPVVLSNLEPKEMYWLWPFYLPGRTVAVLDGDPGQGKSLLAIDIAARLSRGVPMPHCRQIFEPSSTIILAAEDDYEFTIRPRAEAAGADLSRLIFPQPDLSLPRFPRDCRKLLRMAGGHVRLIIIDPLSAFLEGSVNVDQAVRKVLYRFAQLADMSDATILCIRHLSKRESGPSIHRGHGSMGIIAAARCALFAVPHPSQPIQTLTVTKSNLGPRPPSLGYRIVRTESGWPKLNGSARSR